MLQHFAQQNGNTKNYLRLTYQMEESRNGDEKTNGNVPNDLYYTMQTIGRALTIYMCTLLSGQRSVFII